MVKYTLLFSKPVKSDHNKNFKYFLNNHIKTTKIFSVRSSPDPAKIGFSPDPVRSSPVRAHLSYVVVNIVFTDNSRAFYMAL